MNETSKYVSMFILLLLLLTIYYTIFVLPKALSTTKAHVDTAPAQNVECSDSAVKPCVIKSCQGTKTCKNGEWGTCTIKIVCKPNSTAPCVENGCVAGHKICDSCGTGYGDCIYNNN